MYWADKIASDLKKRNLPLEWVDDMKTPSGRIHIGSLRGVVIHDLLYKALLDQKQKAVYTYCINDMDPVDGGNFPDHMGWPLFKTPFAKDFAKEFISVFEKIGCQPKIVWTSDLYKDGKFDKIIKIFLDKTAQIRKLFKEQYQSFKEDDYYPYQPICPKCGKIATTKIYKWDGHDVYFRCQEKAVNYTKGCGFEGKVKPEKLNGKMPWKIEWSAHWKTLGVTIEWAGKDHMTAGGSHEIAAKISEKILNYLTPQAESYEHLLIGGKKMSSSKGLGSSAKEVSEILPPKLLRFLIVRTDYKQAINFDAGGNTIPDLFDEYDRCAKEFWENKTKSDFGRIYELSQIDPQKPEPACETRFRQICQWIQMPNMADKILNDPQISERAKYARIWLEKFAPENEKFTVKNELPKEVGQLSETQQKLLVKIAEEINKDWQAEKLQTEIYEWGKELGLKSGEVFQAIYLSLLGKTSGPKAAWLILSLDKEFLKKRFRETASVQTSDKTTMMTKSETKSEEYRHIYYIDSEVMTKYPGMKTGIAIINNVKIKKKNEQLEMEKQKIIKELSKLTTEDMGNISTIVAYRKIFKAFGVDWHSRHPSADALLRRVVQGKGLYNINTFVDAYNLAVLDSKIALGAFEYEKVNYPVVLRLAKAGEKAYLLGDDQPTEIDEGEMVYADQDRILTLDLNYRDGEYTKVTEKTKKVILFADGCPGISEEEVMAGLEKGIEFTMKYCGGELKEKFLVF